MLSHCRHVYRLKQLSGHTAISYRHRHRPPWILSQNGQQEGGRYEPVRCQRTVVILTIAIVP